MSADQCSRCRLPVTRSASSAPEIVCHACRREDRLMPHRMPLASLPCGWEPPPRARPCGVLARYLVSTGWVFPRLACVRHLAVVTDQVLDASEQIGLDSVMVRDLARVTAEVVLGPTVIPPAGNVEVQGGRL